MSGPTVTEKEKTTLDSGFTVWPFVDKIYVAKLQDNAKIPTRKHKGDAGLDFYSVNSYEIPAGHVKVVGTGITVELPPHYFGLLKPKSGSNFDVLAGVIDPNYQGEILFKVYNPPKRFGDTLVIREGDPVGQMVLIPIIRPPVVEISPKEIHVEESDRASTGGILEDE
jgi:dUTP pyrophosphatase